MADNDEQGVLNRILEELKSKDRARRLRALEELNELGFSNDPIHLELERQALNGEGEVQKAALAALSSGPSQLIASQRSSRPELERSLILNEIDQWQQDGLVEPRQAEVLRRRYDFDRKPARSVQPVAENLVQEKERSASMLPAESLERIEKLRGESRPLSPTAPRPSLMQTLLSEASIKIYLYLGAFFVIAAALILAALVEAARLPILAVATVAFGGAALFLHKRLPQPSFALFIVFSFLLPIDGNVIAQSLGLSEPSRSIYWTFLFLIMAAIWGFSVWLYESRFFSAVAFVALGLALYRASRIFNTQTELTIFLGMLGSFTGLAGTWILKRWKDAKFALFFFLVAQAQVLGLLFLSLLFIVFHLFEPRIFDGSWLVMALTWLAAAVFFALSNRITPLMLFPWMAVGALLPLPWFVLNAFDVTQTAYAIGFMIWGTVLALASEAAYRFRLEKSDLYHWALLAGSLPLFLVSLALALDWAIAGFTFTIFAWTALAYGALHLIRPRWYIWSVALSSALSAYFTFFQIPAVESLDIPLVYQLLVASALLVVPELFSRSPLTLRSASRLPALGFGIAVSVLCIALAFADFDHKGRGALVLMSYAVLLTLHAVHGKRPWLRYLAALFETLALILALIHFDLDLWLPALTALSILYFVTGFLLRRMTEAKAWGIVLINSSLVLGVFLSFTALALAREASGWYILLIAILFAVELFARPFVPFELGVETLLSMSFYLILQDFHVTHIGHFLFGATLIWLGGDLIFGRLIQEKRIYRPVTRGVGFALLLLSTIVLTVAFNPGWSSAYFGLYVLFFAALAYLQREPRLGYLSTGFLALLIIKLCQTIDFEKWTFPLIVLAVLYYLAGYWLRRIEKGVGWEKVFLYSGLGLGALVLCVAPLQGGLDASIPMAIAATLFAVEAYARRSVWWALPANIMYLASYFVILINLKVEEPQFYSIGAALLGMLMHYLLTLSGSKSGAFIAGMLSQLVLLGTTYIQMVSTQSLSFFVVLFLQSMLVLIYGLSQRSRSLVITPIAFAVIGVMTVIYTALRGLGPVILIGSTGVLLLVVGIVAVLMRERFTRLGEQLSDWRP